jgi:DNA replication initiation complex subunit (GINS family)
MYDQLFAAWKREIDDPTLGGLEPDFYVKVTEYLAHIKEDKGAIDKKSIKVSLLEHEALNVERMLKELLALRYRKIIKTITKMHRAPIELLTAEEAKMCQNFVGFENSYAEFAKNLMDGVQTTITVSVIPPPTFAPAAQVTLTGSAPASPAPNQATKNETKPAHKRLTLRFVKSIPAIMGADMKSYGPFNAEDVAALPALNAQILIKQGLAVLVEVS